MSPVALPEQPLPPAAGHFDMAAIINEVAPWYWETAPPTWQEGALVLSCTSRHDGLRTRWMMDPTLAQACGTRLATRDHLVFSIERARPGD